MDLAMYDKVRFKKGAYSTITMGVSVPEWRLELEGLIGEVEYKHWRSVSLPKLYRVRVHHPKSGITVTDDFDLNEIEGPVHVELEFHRDLSGAPSGDPPALSESRGVRLDPSTCLCE